MMVQLIHAKHAYYMPKQLDEFVRNIPDEALCVANKGISLLFSGL